MAITERYVTRTSDGGDGSIGDPWTLLEAMAGAAAGDRVNIEDDGTAYALGATLVPDNPGTVAQPIILRGYKTDIGDGDQGRTGADSNGPLGTTNMPEIGQGANQINTQPYVIWEALNFTGFSGTLAALDFAQGTIAGSGIKQCVVLPANALAEGVVFDAECFALDCDIAAGGASAAYAVSLKARCLVYGCRIDGNGGAAGVEAAQGSVSVISNAIWNATRGINGDGGMAGTSVICRNTIYDCTDAIVLDNSAVTDLMYIIDNHITDCSGKMISNPYIGTAAHPLLISHNRTRDITSGNGDVADWPVFDAVTTDVGDKDTDYEDADADDFRLKSTAAGVAKGVLPPGNIGAYELPAGGGGGGLLVHPGMSGGMRG
jgi:hypothetical protein